MKITQVRNATLIVEYAGIKFLVDPYLAKKEAYPGFPGTFNDKLRNPRVDLKTPMETILDVNAVIVTHTHNGNPHGDHWDKAAAELVPKHLPIFAQNEADAERIKAQGFKNVNVLSSNTLFRGVTLSWTAGRHGSEEAEKIGFSDLGDVCGVIFRKNGEKTLYLTGDTRWNSFVAHSLNKYKPDIIVMNAGFAIVPGIGGIIMGCEDVCEVAHAAPDAKLIASHLEAVNHATVTRTELRKYAEIVEISDRLHIPEDGETFYV
ncbi:MBL fold metallo-hydrolase [Franconibacter daqui]|uniref:MBL fold metallo-hydrolase n=1 Tax=Franconibacter daqui TaxID=2047724 RepID=UPI002DB63111|nr:MBL fold metallo-hydrolase [Franconibacter daqui]MEB5924764.1 MBL fold metallo-hydrolase [Franconibacter daqui]